VWFLSRRCTQRQFLLKPSKRANQAFLYALAVAAEKTGVKVLWAIAMSNHQHAGIYDPLGNMVEFTREFHRLVAKHHNAMYGRWENFWACETPTDVLLEGAADILDKLVYCLANPCSAHLVERARQWPGVISLPEQFGKTMVIKRPKTYFREDGPMPAEVELTFHKPPQFEHLSMEEYRELVARRLRAVEDELIAKRRAEGRKVLGRRAVLRQSHEDSPRSVEPRRVRRPRLAAKSVWRRLEAIRRLKQFIKAYAEALAEWRNGNRNVEFPYGTYAMRVFHGARCATAPT
jgi:hypothetical protein